MIQGTPLSVRVFRVFGGCSHLNRSGIAGADVSGLHANYDVARFGSGSYNRRL